MSENANDSINKKNESRKRTFARIKAATSIYVIKAIVFVGIAAIAYFTSQTVNAVLLSALTYMIGFIFDMWVLTKDNTVPVIFWVEIFQWIVFFIIVAVSVCVAVLLFTYDGLVTSSMWAKQNLETVIRNWIPVFMCVEAVVAPLMEAFYSLPSDD